MKKVIYKKIDSNQENYDSIAKFILIGDKQVGKSSFLKKYISGEYSDTYTQTIGSEIKTCALFGNNKNVKLQIWDTPGQEKFRTSPNNFYKGTLGVVIMFDITNIESFINIRGWVDEVNKYKQDDIHIILVGNKCDKPESSHKIKNELALALAEELDCQYIKISTKDNLHINDVFSLLLDKIYNCS